MENRIGYRINKIDFVYSCFELLILVICAVFPGSKISSVVSIIVFCLSLIRLLNCYAVFFIKYLAVLFSTISVMVGCIVIEFSDIYISEIQSNSSYVGCLPLLLLSFWVLIQTIYRVDLRSNVKLSEATLRFENKNIENAIIIVSVFVFVAFLAQFISIASHPAFIVGLERAAYSSLYLTNPLLNTLYNYSILLVIIPILLIVNCRGWRRLLGISCVVLNILNALWMGNKFGSLLQLLEIVLIVFSGPMLSKLTNKRIKKYAFVTGLIMLLLVVGSVIIKHFNSESIVDNYFSYRVAAQGELWWKIYSVYDGGFNLSNFPNEIMSFFTADDIISNNVGANYGIYHVMYLTANSSYVDSFLQNGYRYSQAGFAAMYYYFGYIGPLFYAFVFGLLFSKITNKLIKALNRGLVIESFIYIRLLIFSYSCFANFIFNFFFSTLTVLTYIYLVVARGNRIKFRITERE